MEKQQAINFWWEDEFDELLLKYNNGYVHPSDLKLFIIKIIETEKGLVYPPVKYGKADRDEAKKLRAEGNSLRKIAKIMNIKSAQSIANLIK